MADQQQNQPNVVPVDYAQVIQATYGAIALQADQTKLPNFLGDCSKDCSTANEFTKRMNKRMTANNWSRKVAFNKLSLALKGLANSWLQNILKSSKGTVKLGRLSDCISGVDR